MTFKVPKCPLNSRQTSAAAFTAPARGYTSWSTNTNIVSSAIEHLYSPISRHTYTLTDKKVHVFLKTTNQYILSAPSEEKGRSEGCCERPDEKAIPTSPRAAFSLAL